VVAVAGSFVPAVEAARASPALALKAGDEERAYARLRPVGPGLAVMALGAAATTMPPVVGCHCSVTRRSPCSSWGR
jgi:putative ABC transport system permease protein